MPQQKPTFSTAGFFFHEAHVSAGGNDEPSASLFYFVGNEVPTNAILSRQALKTQHIEMRMDTPLVSETLRQSQADMFSAKAVQDSKTHFGKCDLPELFPGARGEQTKI